MGGVDDLGVVELHLDAVVGAAVIADRERMSRRSRRRWLIIGGFEGVIAPHTLDNDGAVAGLPDEEVAAGAAVHGGGADAGIELVLALAAVQGLVVAGA